MSHYNIAVTVGPNIFRPVEIKPADLFNAGTYYHIMIMMMKEYETIFGAKAVPKQPEMLDGIKALGQTAES